MAETMGEPIRFGVAGCGWISRHVHLPNLRGMKDVRVVAVADSDPAAATNAAGIVPGAAILSGWQDLIDRADIDAIIIALPTSLHAAAAVSALRAGLHAYIEKPLATTLRQAAQVQDAGRTSNAVAMVGFNYRFNRLYRSLRAAIETGRIGEVLAVRSVFSTTAPAGGWRSHADQGGGVLLDLASHHIDLIRFITRRDVAGVMATVRGVRAPADTVALQLELSGGATAQSWFTMSGAETDTMEVIGTTGSARVSRYESLAIHLRGREAGSGRAAQIRDIGRAARNVSYLWHKRRAPGHEPSWGIAMKTFVQAVRGEATDYPGLADGVFAAAVIDAAATAATTGCARAVTVDRTPPAPGTALSAE